MFKELETSTSGLSETEVPALVRQARDGDAEAFARLLSLFESRLHRRAVFLAGDEQRGLDLLQETLLQTWKHLARYDDRASFLTWTCSIMLHRHYDWLRRLRTRAFTIFTAAPDETYPEDRPNPREASENQERAHLMRACLDRLPARQRDLVFLRFYAGESLEGIAALTRCSVGTVKSRLFHALARLAKMQNLKQFKPEGKRS